MAKKIRVTSAKVTRTWIVEEDLGRICSAWENYSGQVTVMESAIGALLVGRLIGYNGLRVLHSWRTLRVYEKALGDISFKDLLPEETPDSERLNGIRWSKEFKQFWRALAGGVATKPGARDLVTE